MSTPATSPPSVLAAPPVIQTRGLTRVFGTTVALADCSLEVRPGEVFGLLGPNGAGKTTLIRTLMGLTAPTRGTATIGGFDIVRDRTAVHSLVSYLPGEIRSFGTMTGGEWLALMSSLHPRRELGRTQELARALVVPIDRKLRDLSTGMRQKLALAAVLGVTTPVIILDEPTANLDPTVRMTLLELIRDLRHRGQAVVFSSHVLVETERVSDRVGILCGGRLVHVQVVSDLKHLHRIRARITGPMPPVPADLVPDLELEHRGETLTLRTAGELSRLFGWLSILPIEEVRIEPLGLEAVYERFHPVET